MGFLKNKILEHLEANPELRGEYIERHQTETFNSWCEEQRINARSGLLLKDFIEENLSGLEEDFIEEMCPDDFQGYVEDDFNDCMSNIADERGFYNEGNLL